MDVNKLRNTFLPKDYDFVEFTDQIDSRIKVYPMYFQLGFSPSPLVFGRYAVLQRLYDTANGFPLYMGTEFDDCTEKANRDYFNNRMNLSVDEEKIKKHRNLLRNAMEGVGFTSYQHEWWHFDLGNIFWSKNTNYPEVFGPLFGDEEFPKNL